MIWHVFNWMSQPIASIFSDTGFSGKSFNVDVKDNGDSYELKAELPGFAKEDVHLSYKDNYLSISANKEESKDEKDDQGNFIRRERYCGSMSRSFYIDNIDENKCNADFKDGILTITMPKLSTPSKLNGLCQMDSLYLITAIQICNCLSHLFYSVIGTCRHTFINKC